MGKKYDSCVKQVDKKLKQGKLKKTYKCGNKRCKTNSHAICNKLR